MSDAEPEPIDSTVDAKLCPVEFWLALAGALLLGILAVGRAVWDGDTIYLATDTATVQAPWHSPSAAQNPQLSDSGVAFYPHYRKVSERWLEGELPLWNPDLYAGVPLLANPQWGGLDPQVGVLVVLDALGGRALFDRGFAWLAALRIAAAALGTYLLARRLGLGSSGATIAGLGYALSGSVILWLGFSLSHVTPCLPWLLLGIEWLRMGERVRLGWCLTSLSLALAIYGGHPEVAFFTGFCGGLWCLRLLHGEARRLRLALGAMLSGVLLGAPVLVPFIEYLANSGALVAHKLAPSQRGRPDLLALAMLFGFLALHRLWLRKGDKASAGKGPLLRDLLLGVALFGLFASLAELGARFDPGWSTQRFIERGSSWVAFPILALSFSALIAGPMEAGPRRALWLFGPLSLALATSAPGVVDLWRWIPLVGLAAPARAACVAALSLSLLAGHGLQHGKRSAQTVVLTGLFLLAGLFLYQSSTQPSEARTLVEASADPVVVYDSLPSADASGGSGHLRGTIHGGLRADAVRLLFQKVDGEGELLAVSDFVHFARLSAPDEAGAVTFDFGEFDLTGLGPGRWRLVLEFQREGEVLGRRQPCTLIYPSEGGPSPRGLGFAGLALLGLLWVDRRRGRQWMTLLVAAQGLFLAQSWNPTVPLDAHFHESATERYLAEHHRGKRFVADPGILPENTALLAGLTTIGGYDAMDVASFDGFRMHAIKHGRNPLLHWNVDGFDLGGPGFRLFGVELLLSHTARNLDGWNLLAGPGHERHPTEVYVYGCENPVPRSYCVAELRTLKDVLADPASFDPARQAFLGPGFSLAFDQRFTRSTVRELTREPEQLQFEVDLDGEGLFVSTEQHFPGWKLWVDGVETPILRVNSLFRGVFLGPGKHDLRFAYEPQSWQRGLGLGAVGLLILLVGGFAARGRSASEL